MLVSCILLYVLFCWLQLTLYVSPTVLSDQEQYLEQGASFVLTKPVSEDSLKKYLFIADRRRAELLHPELKQQREAEVLGSTPT